VEGTGWQEQYLIDQGIIQNRSLSSALLNCKSAKRRARNIGLNCKTSGSVGREEVDTRPVEQTITTSNNQLLVLP